jgi:hypothetical protein
MASRVNEMENGLEKIAITLSFFGSLGVPDYEEKGFQL